MTAVLEGRRAQMRRASASPREPQSSPVGDKSGWRLLPLGLMSLAALVPLVLVLVNSFRPTADIYRSPLGLPSSDGAANYQEAWSAANFSQYFVNSLLVTSCSLLLGVGAATLAGYALGRIEFRGRRVVSAAFLAGLLFPVQLGVVPIFYTLDRLGLIDSRVGLVLVYASQVLPLGIYVIAVFFQQLPAELEEAARLDGAGELRIFWTIMLPLVRPAVATVTVVQCAPIWNDFFYPLVLLRNPDSFTLPVGLTTFFGQYQSDFGALFAALVIVSLPLILLFVVATKYVVAGFTAGIGK